MLSFLFLAVGGVLGFLSGLFGVGGSSIATPLLRWLGVPRLSALASPLPVTLPTALVGGWTYWRRGQVDASAAFWTAVGGAPASALGALLTGILPGRLLMLLAGLLVLIAGARLLRPALRRSPSGGRGRRDERALAESRPLLPRTPPSLLGVGVAVGLLAGLLANGGGFLLMPAYLLLFGMEPQEAAGTSLLAVAGLAIPATGVHWHLGHVDPMLALLLTVGVLPATSLGARIGSRLEGAQARPLFGLFLTLFGLAFLGRTLLRAELHGWE